MKHILTTVCVLACTSFAAMAATGAIAITADGSQDSYPLSDVRAITFAENEGNTTMTINEKSGATHEGYKVIMFGESTGETLVQNAASIAVYPNPVSEYIMIEGAAEDAEATIYDANGRKVASSKEQRIDVSSFPSGLYTLIIGSKAAKFIKR